MTLTPKVRQIAFGVYVAIRNSGDAYHGTAELFTSSGQGLLIFDPLDNRNPTLRINYQKVS